MHKTVHFLIYNHVVLFWGIVITIQTPNFGLNFCDSIFWTTNGYNSHVSNIYGEKEREKERQRGAGKEGSQICILIRKSSMMFFSTDGASLVWRTLESVIYHRKSTTLPDIRYETENVCAKISMTQANQEAVCHSNKGLEASGHHFDHLSLL